MLVFAPSVMAQDQPDTADRVPSVEPLLQAVRKSIVAEQWLDATRSFDVAWEQLCASEDQSADVRLPGENNLLPGEHVVGAGMKARMRILFRSAPDAFRAEYQRQFDSAAEVVLGSAIQQRRENALRSLVERHQFCESATSALRVLAAWYYARGDFLGAALTLDELLARLTDRVSPLELLLAESWKRAGFESEARQTVVRLCEHAGFSAVVTTRNGKRPLPDNAADVQRWMSQHLIGFAARPSSQWKQPLGSAGRSRSQHRAPATLREHWQRPLFQSAAYPQFNPQLTTAERRLLSDQNFFPNSPTGPLVVGNLVVFQAIGSLQAVDRETGRLVWESRNFNRQLRAALESNSPVSLVSGIITESLRNHVRGQMCTDGRLLFCVEETTQGAESALRIQQPAVADASYNLLRVYDLKTGKMRGQAGGLAPEKDPANSDPFAGMYFLGTPLLLNDRILVIAEDSQGIHLLDLRLRSRSASAAGELVFDIADRQLLSVPRFELSIHPVRRYAGITPSLGNGLIICQACDEMVLGVSTANLSIEWIHRYRTSVDRMDLDERVPVVGNAINPTTSRLNDVLRRSHDSLARVAGRYVLVMPRDSGQLICLDVSTGRQLWAWPRGGLRFFAALSENVAVLAGGSEIRAVRLGDGQRVWHRELDDDGVSGQPAGTGRLVHLPTQQGHIVTLDLHTGRRLLSETVSETPVGNLLSLSDQLIAQSQTQLMCWQGILPETADDRGIAKIRDSLLHNDPDSLIPALDQLISEAGSDSTVREARALLTDLLMESLRLDFPGNRHQIPKLRELIAERTVSTKAISDFLLHTLGITLHDAVWLQKRWTDLQQHQRLKDQLEQLIVRGLSYHSDQPLMETAEQIAHVVRNNLEHPTRVVTDGRLQLQASSGTAAAIHQALKELSPDDRQRVVEYVRPTVEAGFRQTASDERTLRRVRFCWMAGLGDCLFPISNPVYAQIPESMHLVVVSQLVVSNSVGLSDPESALDSLGALWRDSKGISADVWPSLDQLAAAPPNDDVGRLTDFVRESQRRAETGIRPLVRPARVTAGDARTATRGKNPIAGAPSRLIPLHGKSGAYRGWRFTHTHLSSQIVALDDRGDVQWRFQPPTRFGRRGAGSHAFGRQAQEYAVACGFLLAVCIDQFVHMLNPAELTDGQPHLLWSLDLQTALAPPSQTQQFFPGWQRTTIYDRQPDGLAPVGPLTEFGLPVFQGRRLAVMDPWTGEQMWILNDLPDDCRLAAEQDQLCVISESAGQVEVRNMRDGRSLRSGPLPTWWTAGNSMYDSSVRHIEREAGTDIPWRIIVEGTHCVVFRLSHDRAALMARELTSPDTDGMAVAWELPLPADSVFSNVAEGVIAVLSETSRIRLVRIADGTVLGDHDVLPAPNCDRLYLRHSHGRLIVLTHITDPAHDQLIVGRAVPVSGPVYCFDSRSFAPVWTGSTEHEYLRILNPEQSPTLSVAPLLIILRRVLRHGPDSKLRSSDYAVRILDVDNGETLYEETGLGNNLSYHALRFEGNRRFTVSFNPRDITFDFSGRESADNPDPPDQPGS